MRHHRPDLPHCLSALPSRRRALLGLGALLAAAAPAAHAADPSAAELSGTWRVAAGPGPQGEAERASLQSPAADRLVLRLGGELARAVDGPVELRRIGAGRYRGLARTGVTAQLDQRTADRLDLVLQGAGLYFVVALER